MSELQFVRVEGDAIVVRSADGVEFQLPVDDILRGELKQSSSAKKTSANLSPREIQDAIRAGQTIQQLVEAHEVDASYVEKFAQPVLDELQHVIASAQAVRINLAGDRFTDVTQIDFGSLITKRLSATGATDIAWASKRQDLTTWLVTISYSLPAGDGHATWSFDPRKLTLSPENESALTLSSAESLSDAPIPRLRPVSTESTKRPSAEPVIHLERQSEQPETPSSAQATEKIEVPTRSTIKEAIARATDEAGSKLEPEVEQPEANQKTDEVMPNPADLLDAIRRKRLEREAANPDELPHKATGASRPLIPLSEPEPITTSIRIINDEPLVEAEASQLPEFDAEDFPAEPSVITAEIDIIETDAAAPKPEPKKGRAGIPSWDEIVFGTKTDD